MSGTAPDWPEILDATWPAARRVRSGPWILREGGGGGSRVSATTQAEPGAPVTGDDIAAAEAAMRAAGQTPLFMIRPQDAALDHLLDRRGYAVRDATTIYACPIAALTDRPLPRVTVFALWEPLAIMRELWAAGGIGPARIAVMERVTGPKTGLLARHRDKPAGAAFVAIHDGAAMVHAIEIPPFQRREGIGGWIMRGAAFWAQGQGANTVLVACTRQNVAANALYASLGMQVVGQYHYRHLPTEPDPK